MRHPGLRTAIALWLVTAAAAHAQVEPYHLSLTPFAGYEVGGTFTDKTSGAHARLDEAASAGLIVNLPASDTTEYEFIYSHQGTDVRPNGTTIPSAFDLDLHTLQLGGTYVFEGGRAQPYIAATLGATFLDPSGATARSETDFSFSFGAGLRLFPASRVFLRLEGRVLGTVVSSDSDIFCASGVSGASCLIRSKADILWQWLAFAGVGFRF